MNLLRRWWSQAPATVAFCVLTIVGFVITATESRSLLNNLSASAVGDWCTLYLPNMTGPFGALKALTAAFMHLGPAHLALNLMLLFLLGREVEQAVGSRLFTLLWLVSAVGASTVSVWAAPLAPTVGASGVCYALMAVFVLVMWRRGGDLRGPLVLIAANLGYTFITPAVSLWGHVGGLLVGALLAVALLPRSRGVQWLGVSGIGVLIIVALLWRISTATASTYLGL